MCKAYTPETGGLLTSAGRSPSCEDPLADLTPSRSRSKSLQAHAGGRTSPSVLWESRSAGPGPVAAVAAGDGLVTPLGRALPPLLKPVVLGEARCTVV